MSVKLTISGDFCVTSSYVSKILMSDEIMTLFSQSDINIVNLECPINNENNDIKIIKNGPHLQTTDEIIEHLKALNIGAITLANNHILDFGNVGLMNTLKKCKENNIITTGVGKNLKEASEPVIIEKNDLRIALVNFCENEWCIATEDTAGANPLDIVENYNQIKKAKAVADFVLVIIHGGNEFYNLPSPRMVKLYRFFADCGATAIIGHHTHCISGLEVHNNVPIFYGLGNMLFTNASDNDSWFTGLTIKLNLQKGQLIKWDLIPTSQSKESFSLNILEDEKKDNVINEIESYSAIIVDEKKLKVAWESFIENRKDQYLFAFSSINLVPGRYLRSLLKRLGVLKLLFPRKYLLTLINYINCEAHLDISRKVLGNKILKK